MTPYLPSLNAELDQNKAEQQTRALCLTEALNLLGDVTPIRVSHPKGDGKWIQLIVGVGILCGYDESLYLYEWSDRAWNRRYELEQNDYGKDQYLPRIYDGAEVSPQIRRAIDWF